MQIKQRKSRRESGGAMVEFAVVSPIFAMLIFGMIQYGIIINAQISLQDTAEMTARHVVVDGDSDINSITTYAQQAMPSNLPSSNLASPVGYNPAFVVGSVTAVRITLQYNLPLLIPFVVPGSAGGVKQLTASAIMR